MPWVDILAAVALAVFAGAAPAGPRAGRRLLLATGAVAAGLLALGFILEGARWQLLVLAVVAVALVPFATWTRRRRPAYARVLVLIGAFVATVGIAVASWALPPALIPQPTGTFAVGVSSEVFTDAARGSRGGPPDGTVRSLPTTIWYPTEAAADTSALLADDATVTVDGLASQYGLPSWALQQLRLARGHAASDGPALGGTFPVVFFSPGLGSSRWLAASWAAEIASHGVVVVAVDHPYDAAAVTIADGSVVRSDLEDTRLSDQWTQTRTDDFVALLDILTSRQADVPALAGADFSRLVATGHSRGGAAALLFAETDARVDGVVNIDGMPATQTLSRGIPAVIVRAGDAEPNPPYDAATTALVDAGATRVTVDGVAHFGFTDAAFVIAPIPGVVGSAAKTGQPKAAAAALAVVDAVTRERPVDPVRLAELGAVG